MKYADQICAIKHKNQTLGIDNKFYAPTKEDIEKGVSNPWEIHGKYSKALFTLIETGTKKYASYNLDAHDIPKLFEDSKFYNQMFLKKHFEKNNLSTSSNNSSIAYTTVISLGNFKGKTPAQVLIENSSNKEALLKTKEFLSQNAEKYPANKKQMNAIDDAISLLESNNLKQDEISSSNEIVPTKIVFYDKIKCNPTKDNKGIMDVKKISISYNPEMKSPINITILNCNAPSSNNGLISVNMSQASNKKEISMFVGMDEWFETISRIHRVKELWELKHIPIEEENSSLVTSSSNKLDYKNLEEKLDNIMTFLLNN